MIRRDVVAAQPSVRQFDPTPKLQEYGFTIGNRSDLEKAKTLVNDMVAEADKLCDKVISDLFELDQNPYISTVKIDGADVDHALEIPLFRASELSDRMAAAFPQGSNGPKRSVIAARIKDGLAAKAKEADYEVAGIEQHKDGSLLRIVLRDPDYVRDVTRHRQGLAPQKQVASLAEITTSLAEQAHALRQEMSTEAFGCERLSSGEKILSARAAVGEIIETAVATIIDRMTGLRQGEVSPFRDTPYQIPSGEAAYRNPALTVRGGFFKHKVLVERPIILNLIDGKQALKVLEGRIGEDCMSQVTKRRFLDYVRDQLIVRLRAEQSLPLAAVVHHPNPYADSHWEYEHITVVFTDPTQQREPSWMWKLLTFGQAKPTQMLALPAPAPEPQALPAPAGSQAGVEPTQPWPRIVNPEASPAASTGEAPKLPFHPELPPPVGFVVAG